jgi:hypothetical protein
MRVAVPEHERAGDHVECKRGNESLEEVGDVDPLVRARITGGHGTEDGLERGPQSSDDGFTREVDGGAAHADPVEPEKRRLYPHSAQEEGDQNMTRTGRSGTLMLVHAFAGHSRGQ